MYNIYDDGDGGSAFSVKKTGASSCVVVKSSEKQGTKNTMPEIHI